MAHGTKERSNLEQKTPVAENARSAANEFGAYSAASGRPTLAASISLKRQSCLTVPLLLY